MPARDVGRLFRRVHNPNDLTKATMAVIQDRVRGKRSGVTTGIAPLDRVLDPLFPGELMTVLANTSHYKSGFLNFVARHVATQLNHDAERENEPLAEYVAYVTWEMTAEELTLYGLASAAGLSARDVWLGQIAPDGMLRLQAAAAQREFLPLWILGDSLSKRSDGTSYTLEDVREQLSLIKEQTSFQPRAIFLDYLQDIDPMHPMRDRRSEVMENVVRAKKLGREFGCPVIQAAQANRNPGERGFRLPELRDSEESARIEQASDKIVALWMPKMDVRFGQPVPTMERLIVTENLLICGVRKQRMGRAGDIFPLYIDPTRNLVAGWEEVANEPY